MPRFVIQQHDATSMHYDFRLEVDGTFKSWAVPKGPSTDPREKRLAMAVDDHEISWGDFEGVIGGGYGAGRVIVWDRGTYESLHEEPMGESLAAGHASFWLEGQKLRGGWTMRHTDGRRWLLIKRRDEEADARRRPTSTQPESVVSGRRIDEVES
jgi:DNA ligase D-like protein (predicted 3'-phosphoesterase)